MTKKIHQFGEPTKVGFASKITNYLNNTIKVEVEVQDWPFRAIRNSLLLIFSTQIINNGTPQNNGKCKDYLFSEDSNGNLNWISLYMGGVIMYPAFHLFPFFYFLLLLL